MAATKGIASGAVAALKKGAPTEIFAPNRISANIGQSVPTRTTAVMEQSSRLFSTSAPSREIGANIPVPPSRGARQANNAKAPVT